ncbi:MAG: hypothetical protein ABIF45_17540 [Pseudomonadota bacterium]
MNIHKQMSRSIGVAKIYARDGAFHTAARVLLDLSNQVKAHAVACDEAMNAALNQRDPVNLQGSGPAPIELREG